MTATEFPLYHQLLIDIDIKRITSRQKKSMINKINQFDQTGYEYLYALIRYHQLKNSHTTHEEPYKCIVENDTMTFDITNLPNELTKILYHIFLKRQS